MQSDSDQGRARTPLGEYKPGTSTWPPGPQWPHLRRGYYLLPYVTMCRLHELVHVKLSTLPMVNAQRRSAIIYGFVIIYSACFTNTVPCAFYSFSLNPHHDSLKYSVHFIDLQKKKKKAQSLLTVRVTKLWKGDSTHEYLTPKCSSLFPLEASLAHSTHAPITCSTGIKRGRR